MKTGRRRTPGGFTLVELVMAAAVGLVILAAVLSAVMAGQRSAAGIERRVSTGQDARIALEVMGAELRMVSYNPLYVAGLWVDPDSCEPAKDQDWRGIQEATASSITIETDLDADGLCGSSPSEIIRYAYDENTARVTRETIRCSAGRRTSSGAQPFLGPIPSNAAVRTLRVVNGAVPLFRYYDGTGAEVVNLPDGIPRIRRIEIALIVESADADPRTGQPRRLAFSTSVVPKNHGVRF